VKKYEGLFIFPEKLKEDELNTAIGRVRDEIQKLEGVITNTVPLGKRGFARLMQKEQSGHYVRIAFDMAPDKLAALNARLGLMENLFRTQIVKAPLIVPSVATVQPSAAVAGGSVSTVGEAGRGNA
jgi:ribosomal protein S6